MRESFEFATKFKTCGDKNKQLLELRIMIERYTYRTKLKNE